MQPPKPQFESAEESIRSASYYPKEKLLYSQFSKMCLQKNRNNNNNNKTHLENS